MARFCDIEEGTRAIKVIDLPLANVPGALQSDTPEQSRERELNPKAYDAPKVGIRALLPSEREHVLELASKRAKLKGGEAKEGDPLFDHALAIFTSAAACVDPETPPGKDAPLYFAPKNDPFSVEAAAETLRRSRHMTDDIVYFLREQQEVWQDQISPQALTVAEDKVFESVREVAKDADFLLRMRPAMRLHFTRLMASLLLDSLERRFTSSTSETPPTSEC